MILTSPQAAARIAYSWQDHASYQIRTRPSSKAKLLPDAAYLTASTPISGSPPWISVPVLARGASCCYLDGLRVADRRNLRAGRRHISTQKFPCRGSL